MSSEINSSIHRKCCLGQEWGKTELPKLQTGTDWGDSDSYLNNSQNLSCRLNPHKTRLNPHNTRHSHAVAFAQFPVHLWIALGFKFAIGF